MGNSHVQSIDDKVVERFREYVRKKHGKLHTVLGQEVERALEEYLRKKNYEGTHAPTHQIYRPEKSKEIRFRRKK